MGLAADGDAALPHEMGNGVHRAPLAGFHEIANGDEFTAACPDIEDVEFVRHQPVAPAELGDDIVLFALKIELRDVESA